MASEFPPRKRGQRQAGRLPEPACSRSEEEPELVLVYLHQLHIKAPMQHRLRSRGLAGFVFHQQHGKMHVQYAKGRGSYCNDC